MTRRKAVPIVKPPVTWILVADGKQAQAYVRKPGEKRVPLGGNAKHKHYDESLIRELVPVPGMDWKAEALDQYETGRNATGMVFSSAGTARHMSEPRIDARKEVKQHLAVAITDKINEAKAKKRFDRLVLVAPPRTLGELRACLSKATLKSIAAELPKELTHYDNNALIEHLNGIA